MVHLDMKSPNVLVWQFPSPHDDRHIRIQQSKKVWIKIADYGISKMSTELRLHMYKKLPGTPGYKAPELILNKIERVISSEKVSI